MEPDRTRELELLRASLAAVPSAGGAGEPLRPAEDGPAREVCLNLLTVRGRSRHELVTALSRKGYGPEVAARVLDGLARSGLVDDAAFARTWVEQRQQRRGLSRAQLGQELRAKGVGPDEQAEVLATVTDEAEEEAARALLARRLAAMSRLPRSVAVRRLLGLLARRGFSPGVAGRLVDEALAAGGEEAWR